MIIVPPFQSGVIHSVVLFMTCNTDFKILPLNVRGIRFFEKRKAIFNSIANGKEIRYYLFARDLRYSRSWELYGIIMCSLVTSRNIVGTKWILVKDKSDYEVKECQKDGQGRFVLLKVLNQCSFWRNSKTTRWIRTRGKLSGDHWRWLSCYSRCWFGWKWKKTSSKRNLVEKSRTCVQLYFDLIDIWRLRNPVDGDKNWPNNTTPFGLFG